MEELTQKVYALSKLCISTLSSKVEEPRKTINDIKFVLEITDEIISALPLPEHPLNKGE